MHHMTKASGGLPIKMPQYGWIHLAKSGQAWCASSYKGLDFLNTSPCLFLFLLLWHLHVREAGSMMALYA